MNLTDVDDKTIRGARQAAIPLTTFTQQFKDAFFDDLKTLRIKRASHFPAATEPRYIARMIEMISQLMEKEIAYQAEDHSIYFRLSRFPTYGKLAHINLDELRPSGRVSSDEYEKENIGDFALWKAWDEADGEVAWDSPWGRGRPGWHIECSAMATALLGPQLDIHCGGVDNIFPHHEAEIAQSESCTGQTFARHWMHCAHLMVEGQKMAKSLGNFFTLRDLLGKGWSGREVRYALISVNYRLPLNFTFEGLGAARSALQRIDEWQRRIASHATGAAAPSDYLLPQQTLFGETLDEDLNISGALGHLFETIRLTNRAMDQNQLSAADAHALHLWWLGINSILGFETGDEVVPEEVARLVDQRAAARAAKEWSKSDALRDAIASLGWQVKDTKDGQKLTKA
jgi:cysteinyl-tRNA synthetase